MLTRSLSQSTTTPKPMPSLVTATPQSVAASEGGVDGLNCPTRIDQSRHPVQQSC